MGQAQLTSRHWDLTVQELEEKARLVVEQGRFRFVPEEVVGVAREVLASSQYIEKALRYIENAFYIYRATINEGFFAPHIRCGDAYEWPKPSKFSWGSIDAVILGGAYIHGPIPSESQSVEMVTKTEENVETTEINVLSSGHFEKTASTRDLIPGKDDLPKIFKYHICDLRSVGFLASQEWQTASLKTYANPVYHILEDLLKGNLSSDEARRHLEEHLENLDKMYPVKIGRIAGKLEEPNPMALFL